MSLIESIQPGVTTSALRRTTVRDLFYEANRTNKCIDGTDVLNQRLVQIARQLLPDEILLALQKQLPYPQLCLNRWISGTRSRRSLVVATTYRNHSCYRRYDQIIVASTAKHINGVRVTCRDTQEYGLPHYVDDMQELIGSILRDFVQACTHH